MKSIKVVAAIIFDSNKILATQRGYGQFKDFWEFPGGKIEDNESPESALLREIHEELSTDIKIKEHFITIDYDYIDFHLNLQCFICTLDNKDSIKFTEHESAKWLDKESLHTVNWLPADIKIIEKLYEYMSTAS